MSDQTRDFAAALLRLLPDLWKLFERHRGDVKAMRLALTQQDDLLARGRADVDAALAAKGRTDALGSVFHKVPDPAAAITLCGQWPAVGHRRAATDGDISCPDCRRLLAL